MLHPEESNLIDRTVQSGDDLSQGEGPYDLGHPREDTTEEQVPTEPSSLEDLTLLWRSAWPDLTDEQVRLLAG
ncbi:MAG TPA: hypothetical protein VFQ54_05545, partial [Thermomicrobiales bacterium]|nr:hypothetical protein [Thermomicrobiales bacterium]